MSRRKFTREFKESAVKLVREQGCSAYEAGRNLGVDPKCVRQWVADRSAPGGGGGDTLSAENQRLRKENARLLLEREILKKAAAFFAQEQK